MKSNDYSYFYAILQYVLFISGSAKLYLIICPHNL